MTDVLVGNINFYYHLQIQNHPSIYCFANPSNLSKLLDLENFELPISIYKLLRLEPNVAFVNADDVLAIFFILMVRTSFILLYLFINIHVQRAQDLVRTLHTWT